MTLKTIQYKAIAYIQVVNVPHIPFKRQKRSRTIQNDMLIKFIFGISLYRFPPSIFKFRYQCFIIANGMPIQNKATENRHPDCVLRPQTAAKATQTSRQHYT